MFPKYISFVQKLLISSNLFTSFEPDVIPNDIGAIRFYSMIASQASVVMKSQYLVTSQYHPSDVDTIKPDIYLCKVKSGQTLQGNNVSE